MLRNQNKADRGLKMQMSTRERFQAVMNFQAFDRLPILEWAGWWDNTVDRWKREGLPESLSWKDINRHFDQDIYLQYWVGTTTNDCPKPSQHGAGIVENMDDYERIRKLLYPTPALDRKLMEQIAQERCRDDVPVWFTLEGFFWFPRKLLGIEPHLYAFYDQPELMHRINSDLADYMLRVADEFFSICQADFMSFAEDMSYNHGPMLSKELFDEFLLPYYRKVIPRIKERGCLCITDSDGDIATAAPWFEAAGLDGVLPLERQAGVDVAQLREKHPEFRFIGAFDKMTMNQGEAAMRAEFERLLPTAAKGGFIISCDHQTPPGVSLEQYQLYMRLFHEYAIEAGKLSQKQLPIK